MSPIIRQETLGAIHIILTAICYTQSADRFVCALYGMAVVRTIIVL